MQLTVPFAVYCCVDHNPQLGEAGLPYHCSRLHHGPAGSCRSGSSARKVISSPTSTLRGGG